MKKLFILILVFMSANCYAALFGIDGTLFKKETKNIQTELALIKNLQLNNNMEVGTLKNTMRDLNLKIGQMNLELSASVSAINNSKDNSMKSGRDSVVTNDTKIFEIQKESFEYQVKVWKYLFYSVFGLLSWMVKQVFKENSNARFYQNSIAKLSKNGEFETVMQQKRMLEKEKSIFNKSMNLIKQGKDLIAKNGKKEVV